MVQLKWLQAIFFTAGELVSPPLLPPPCAKSRLRTRNITRKTQHGVLTLVKRTVLKASNLLGHDTDCLVWVFPHWSEVPLRAVKDQVWKKTPKRPKLQATERPWKDHKGEYNSKKYINICIICLITHCWWYAPLALKGRIGKGRMRMKSYWKKKQGITNARKIWCLFGAKGF